MDWVQQNFQLAFFASAAGVFVAAGVSFYVYCRNAQRDDTRQLKADLSFLRDAGVFDKIATLNGAINADAWAVMGRRDEVCECLNGLVQATRITASPGSWHCALTGAEFDDVRRFLHCIKPLVWVLRTSSLSIEGSNRPYNGDKKRCAAALYRAFRVSIKKASRPVG